MHSKKILDKDKKLNIIIDSDSFNTMLNRNIDKARIILEYSHKEPFIFYRSPKENIHSEISNIQEVNIKYNEKNTIKSIIYEEKEIIDYTERFLKRSELKDSEIELMKLIYILDDLKKNNKEKPYILITSDENFLNNRLVLDSSFSFSEINILSINEAIEIMGLYSRYQNIYYVRHNYIVNKGLWYDIAFRRHIPNYSFDDINLRNLSVRFVYLLMSVDEMGYQYYLGVNNDIHENIMYHFNYFTILLTGIFDSFALITNKKFNINFNEEKAPFRISLRNKDFLKKLEAENLILYQHIMKFINYINLIYEIRNSVIHRGIFSQMTIDKTNIVGGWKGSFLKINNKIFNLLLKLDTERMIIEGIDEWGLYENCADFQCIDMYVFAKRSLKELIIFSIEYLSLLGYSKEKTKETQKLFSGSVEIFQKHALCYY